jgi:hypothetical protein
MVLLNPEQLLDSRGRKIAQSRFVAESGREHLLRVIYEERDGDTVVVTVYNTARIRKYWRPG